MKRLLLSAALIGLASQMSVADEIDVGTTESWTVAGKKAVKNLIAIQPNTKRAKNVILFVGDGMGISTLTAARILEGQLRGEPGEENLLSFEEFPYTALVKTYNVDSQVADSAGTASALNTGVKTRIGVINTAPDHMQAQCKGVEDKLLMPLAYQAEAAGMSTGIVSTARLTHATPAAVYAHSPLREWESDADMPAEALQLGCKDIAQQILGKMGGDGLEVALGGGRTRFLPEKDGGKRKDGRNLTKEWTTNFNNAAYVEDLDSLKKADVDHILGLFDNSHMDFNAVRGPKQPSLTEMTEAAIKVLSKDEDGYYLMVEAGRVDHAHHGGNAYLALHDAVELSSAVKRTLELVDTEETLILVTADHSHVFTMAGYPRRGNPIFGLVRGFEMDDDGNIIEKLNLAKDGKPYTTLGYQNGPGAIGPGERPTLTDEMVLDPKFIQQAVVPTSGETHGGEDVGLFAVGPWSHLARGTMEQNVIYHIMHHALDLDNR